MASKASGSPGGPGIVVDQLLIDRLKQGADGLFALRQGGESRGQLMSPVIDDGDEAPCCPNEFSSQLHRLGRASWPQGKNPDSLFAIPTSCLGRLLRPNRLQIIIEGTLSSKRVDAMGFKSWIPLDDEFIASVSAMKGTLRPAAG